MTKIIGAIFCCFMFCNTANASVLYAGSAQENVHEGQSVEIDWFLDTENASVNAIDLNLVFSQDTLELVEAGPGNSAVNLWVMQPSLTASGQIQLIGGMPAGLSGKQLPIFRSVFLAKKRGVAKISLAPSSTVLLNDGSGTPDALVFKDLVFPVSPASFSVVITSPTHPDQNKWQRKNNVTIAFAPKPGESYAYSFSSNLEITPEEKAVEIPKEIYFNNLPDGVYYFKLNSKTQNSPWQEAGIYRVQIDQTPPESFMPTISQDPGLFEGKSFLSFSATDKASGIDRYEIKQGLFGSFTEAQTPFKLNRPLVGDWLTVKAYDKADNAREVTVAYKGYVSEKEFWTGLCLLIISACMVLYIYRRKGLVKK